MALFQLLGCEINIGGDRDNTVVRDQFDPVTFPEFLVLRALHGGADHVHSAVAVGERELNPEAEKERLSLKYGAALIGGLFPGAMAALPLGDQSIPTLDEVNAGNAAANAARAATRAASKKPKEKMEKAAPPAAAAPAAFPDITASA